MEEEEGMVGSNDPSMPYLAKSYHSAGGQKEGMGRRNGKNDPLRGAKS